MLNFINNKFRKIILLKTVVLNNLVYDIFCGCFKKNNTEKINKKDIKNKKDTGCCGGISGKGKNNEETITDSTETQDNNNNNNNNNNGKKKVNNENLIKNKKEKLLKILEEIKNDNNYLSDKIEEQDINILKDKIENLNNSNISNIENELNNLRNTIDSKLDKIKNNHIYAVTKIINSIGILENYDKNKYNLKKHTLNIDDVNKTSFSGINDLNTDLDKIKKYYDESINEIVKILKIEFNRLKNEKSDKELDVKDEDFNNLTEPTKIIDIDKKLVIYNIKLKDNKTEIINKINTEYEKLEERKDLIKYFLKKEFEKENNLDNKNIEDLCNTYYELTNINNDLLVKFNKYKEELQNKYIELINIYKKFHYEFNYKFYNKNNFEINNKEYFTFGILKLKFDDYSFDNFKNFKQDIIKFENDIKKEFDIIKNDLNEKIKDREKKLDILEIKYDKININIPDKGSLEEKFNELLIVKNKIIEIETKLTSIEFYSFDEENINKKIKGIKDSLKNKIESKDGKKVKFYENIEDVLKYFINNYNNDKLNDDKVVQFIKEKNNVDDYGGLRRNVFNKLKDHILAKIAEEYSNSYNFNSKDKENSTNYLLFKTEKNDKYYSILAYLCAYSLREINSSSMFLNLNPLIYKIMLNGKDIFEKHKTIDTILNFNDLQYFSQCMFDYVKERNNYNDLVGNYIDMINKFNEQLENIKIFYYELKKYFKDDIFEKFDKNEYWALKYFIESRDVITYENLIGVIDNYKCKKSYYEGGVKNVTEKTKDFIYQCVLDVLKEFSNDEKKQFLMWITGLTCLPDKIYFEFSMTNDTLDSAVFSCHSCEKFANIALYPFAIVIKENKKLSVSQIANLNETTYKGLSDEEKRNTLNKVNESQKDIIKNTIKIQLEEDMKNTVFFSFA